MFLTKIFYKAIVGAGGGLGSLACQYAKAMGYKVLALSSGSSKRVMCLNELEVDYYVDYNSPSLLKEVKDVTDGGPHATLIVSSVEEPFHQALQVSARKSDFTEMGCLMIGNSTFALEELWSR